MVSRQFDEFYRDVELVLPYVGISTKSNICRDTDTSDNPKLYQTFP